MSSFTGEDQHPENFVSLSGKISQAGKLAYTASGKAICEALLAVPQEVFGEASVGYVTLQLEGDLAEGEGKRLKIGQKVEVLGQLWSRKYKNRRNESVIETKVIVKKLGGKK